MYRWAGVGSSLFLAEGVRILTDFDTTTPSWRAGLTRFALLVYLGYEYLSN
jgi:hypothetical protein